jgi:putative oxidoreductase
MEKKLSYAQFYLRLALGIDFLVLALDRFGVWGRNGGNQVSWGDWGHFLVYARQTMSFLPPGLADVLAVAATAAELIFGILLIAGLFTRWAATGSAILTLCFALSMLLSSGISSPISYSVFAVSAGSLLLAAVPAYRWSIDAWWLKNKSFQKIKQ